MDNERLDILEVLLSTDRFWSKCNIRGWSDCWEWRAAKDVAGYGTYTLNGIQVTAHRIAYERVNGYVKDGFVVMHSCDNPSCVNPNHLSIGTVKENNHDMIFKGRHHRRGGRGQLSDDTVRDIRSEYESGGISQHKLASKYGISRLSVHRLIHRQTYSNVN